MSFDKITEKSSNYNHLENKTVKDLVSIINKEDHSIAKSVSKNLDKIEKLINNIEPRMHKGGRLFYIGAGTSGRLGILDASECPPTFGVSDQIVIGLIAGGDKAIRKSQEFAEDSLEQGWEDLKKYEINSNDSVIGIAASGTTPYVVSTIKKCNEKEILTGCITCNSNSPLSKEAKFPIDVVVGPEVVTGSTRMKSGTAQKMILNIISTTLMIRLGRVRGNKMVDMQLSNNKLVDRGTLMVCQETGLDYERAKNLLQKTGSVRAAIEKHQKNG